MRAFLLLLVLIVPFGVLVAADDDKKEEKKVSIEGVWKVVRWEQAGQKSDEAPDLVATFKAGKYTIEANGQEVESGGYKVDTAKMPYQLDLDIKTGNDKGKKQPGIFKLADDKLTACFAHPGNDKRPTKFETSEDDEQILTTLKRSKE